MKVLLPCQLKFQDDDPGGVLEQAGRQRGRAQLLGHHKGVPSNDSCKTTFVKLSSLLVTFFVTMNFLLHCQDSAAPEGKSEISIEKLESQLNTLKTMFAEKQKLVADLEAYGAGHGGGAAPAPAAPVETPAGPAFNIMSDQCSENVPWCS